MLKNIMITCFIWVAFFIQAGCYPVSHIVVGETREPIDFSKVGIYIDYPDSFEKIAIIEAGSGLALKDLSIEFTHQQKTDKALERLKVEAASLGANGIVIENLSTQTKKHFHLSEDSDGEINASTRNEIQKELKAIAIFVK
tara:strand:- start:1615 stop:2037 length:423 start_codon:yes stop_codon:yes gene_type:complete